MNTANPTDLHLGAIGLLDGRKYTVRGRAVLSTEADGETYGWNEYHLVDETGRSATLVYEETDEGSPWKMCRMIEPRHQLTSVEAVAVQVGNQVDFDGKEGHVDFVGRSRVRLVEGQAAEGAKTGDVADFFNAKSGETIFIVSWTGTEMEYYQGQVVSAGRIASAFGLKRWKAGSASSAWWIPEWATFGQAAKWILVVLFAVWFFLPDEDGRAPDPPAKQAAPPARLADGNQAVLAGHVYRITGHALVEVAALRGRYDRLEYDLEDEAGGHALLVNGLGGQTGEWHLLRPLDPPVDFDPYAAAALHNRYQGPVAGRRMQVIQLSEMRVLSRSGPLANPVWPAALEYGLVAQAADVWLLARWTEAGLQLYAGRVLHEVEVLGAFHVG